MKNLIRIITLSLAASFVFSLTPMLPTAGADEIIIGRRHYKNVRIEGIDENMLHVVLPGLGPRRISLMFIDDLKIDMYPELTAGDKAANGGAWGKAAVIYSALYEKVTEDYMKVLVGAKLVATLDQVGRFEDAVNLHAVLVRKYQTMGAHRSLLLRAIEPKKVPRDANTLTQTIRRIQIRLQGEADPFVKAFLMNTLKRLRGEAVGGNVFRGPEDLPGTTDAPWHKAPQLKGGNKPIDELEGVAVVGEADAPIRFDINSAKDPLVRLEILIRIFKLSSTDKIRPREERAAAFDRVRPLYEALLKKAPHAHWKRPIWATDMVQWDYEILLPARHANTADFVEFGGGFATNTEQMDLFSEIAFADVMFMENAGLDAFSKQDELFRNRDFNSEIVTTGKRNTINAYCDLNLPFYKSMAVRYAALLDDDQKGLIAEVAGATFEQLLEDADGDLKRLGDKDSLPAATKAKIYSLHGRIKIARKQPGPAIALLDKAMAIKEIAPFEKLVSLFAKSQALELKKDSAGAMKAIEDAKELVKDEKAGINSPINLILVFARQRALTGKDDVWQEMLQEPMFANNPNLPVQANKWSELLTLQATIGALSDELERREAAQHD